jgi:hypothetical protein
MPIIVHIILPVYLCIGYIMCSKTMLIVIEIVHKSAIRELGQGVTTYSTFLQNELLFFLIIKPTRCTNFSNLFWK